MTDAESAALPSTAEIADGIQELGFACTDCGACCRSEEDGDHVATIFPEEIRRIRDREGTDWRDVARPMPFGLETDGNGETFEWALQVDDCGDCTFFRPAETGGKCGIYADRPLICRTYPFQLAIPGLSSPNAGIVDQAGPVNAYECEGLGREIDREEAMALARSLKRRAVEERKQQRRLLDSFEPRPDMDEIVVHDAEGAKTTDGTPLVDPE